MFIIFKITRHITHTQQQKIEIEKVKGDQEMKKNCQNFTTIFYQKHFT